jgi:hypothetical protein
METEQKSFSEWPHPTYRSEYEQGETMHWLTQDKYCDSLKMAVCPLL